MKLNTHITGLDISLPVSYKEYRTRLHTASLDRINNQQHYYETNCGWCHKFINQSRKDFSLEYYKILCQTVVSYNK